MFESDCFQLIIRQFISIAIAMLLKVPTFRISVCTTRGGILKGYSNIHTSENDRSKEHASGRASNIIDTSKPGSGESKEKCAKRCAHCATLAIDIKHGRLGSIELQLLHHGRCSSGKGICKKRGPCSEDHIICLRNAVRIVA